MFNKSSVLGKIKGGKKRIGCLGIFIIFMILSIIIAVSSGRDKDYKSETRLTDYESKAENTTYDSFESGYETEATTEITTETTIKAQTTKRASNRAGIDPDFKEFWDSYEKFYDTYIYCMNHKDEFSTSEYLDVMSQYADFVEKAEAYDENDDDLTNEEIEYMAAVQARVMAKLTYASMTP